ncbi:MAG: NADH-quinone oxidoreductase subunit L [Deltaproteobacteria bacterium]|nr:NADH-quinone oxidoreductase subunit L [Deltaproteobacteria bacterium]
MAKFAWLCIFFPLIGALITPALSRIHPKVRDYGAVFFSFLAALASMQLIPLFFPHPSVLPIESSFEWLSVPFIMEFGVLIDHLSIILGNVVAIISFIIMVFSLGYMKGDLSVTRYWIFMNLFIASMLLLVFANNLLLFFIGWKLVGLCSWGLIGYYYKDEREYWIGGPSPTPFWTPSRAGLKALIVTGVGDVFLLAGILVIFYFGGSLNFLELYKTVPSWIPKMAEFPGLILLVSLLLIAGPIGKSAQFPLHEWLPEAMAGPTTVSALIHAATMVKSGVYFIARLVPIFYYGYWVAGCNEAYSFFLLVAWIGGITAFVAGTQGMVSLELKKVMAYSTVSQIGYMWLGLGIAGLSGLILVDGLTAGIFHLVSHALFKACLFLCVGSVLHTVHSIYMPDMGSLRKYLPYTWVFMMVAALSLMGFPPLPGFWSKDAVLISTLKANGPLFLMALVCVAITSFYTVRFMGMVFHGDESENVKNLKKKGAHLGEGSWTMWGSCGLLAVMIILMGVLGPRVENFLREGLEYSMVRPLHLPIKGEGHSGHHIVPILSVLFVLIGAVPSYFLYVSRKLGPDKLLAKYPTLKGFHKFLWNRWHIEGFYNRFWVGGSIKLSGIVANRIENSLDKAYHTRLVNGIIKLGGYVVWFIENPLDRFYHSELPDLVKKRVYNKIKPLQPYYGESPQNIGYILILLMLFILFLIFIFSKQ